MSFNDGVFSANRERDSLFAYADKTINGLGLSVTGAFAISTPSLRLNLTI
jgi:hypothetical protein